MDSVTKSLHQKIISRMCTGFDLYFQWQCYIAIALFVVTFAHLHYNKIWHICEAISGYFVVLARNCLTSTLDYIVMQMRKINREKGCWFMLLVVYLIELRCTSLGSLESTQEDRLVLGYLPQAILTLLCALRTSCKHHHVILHTKT